MNNPRCSKGALALAPRHDLTWGGNPCFAAYSPGLKATPSILEGELLPSILEGELLPRTA